MADWLREEGFGKHTKVFQDKYINGEKLLSLDEATMKQQMSLIPPNERRKILASLAQLKDSLTEDHAVDAPQEEDWSDDDEWSPAHPQAHIHQPTAMASRDYNDDAGEDYEVPPTDETSDEESGGSYTEPDDELHAPRPAATAPKLPAKPVPTPVPKPSVPTKPTAKPAPPQKPAELRAVSPSDAPAPPRPPKSMKAPSSTMPAAWEPSPSTTKAAPPPSPSGAASKTGRAVPGGTSMHPPRGISSTSTPPQTVKTDSGRQQPAPADRTSDDSADEEYLSPDDTIASPIQLPSSTNADKRLPTKPSGGSPRAPGAERALPPKPPPASTADKLPATDSATKRLPPRPAAADSEQPVKPHVPPSVKPLASLLKKLSFKSPDSSSSSSNNAAPPKVEDSRPAAVRPQPPHEEVEEAEYEAEPEEPSEPASKGGRSAAPTSSQKIRDFVQTVGKAISVKKMPSVKKPTFDDELPASDTAEQNVSGGSLNKNVAGSSKPGRRPPAELPPPPGQPAPSRTTMPLPPTPGSKQPDSDGSASESGSGSGVVVPPRNRQLPELPVPSTKEEKAPSLHRPKEAPKSKIPAEVPLEQQPWFHPDMNRKDAEAGLQRMNKDGAFVVRNSSKGSGSVEPYSLSVYCKRVFHLLVRRKPDGRFALGTEKPDETTFVSVIEMVDHHKKSAITLSSADGQDTCSTVLTKHL